MIMMEATTKREKFFFLISPAMTVTDDDVGLLKGFCRLGGALGGNESFLSD